MKRLLTLSLLLFATFELSAAPIGEQRARAIATKFFAEHTATRSSQVSLELEWAGDNISTDATRGAQGDIDESLLYIYNRTDAASFVIVAGDDNTRPSIIAYAFDNTFDVNNMPDAERDMLSCWCKQIAAERENGLEYMVTRADLGVGEEVLLYNTAKWHQHDPYNRMAYMFPEGRGLTGCVATALAIVMRHHNWPDKGVGTVPAFSYTITSGSNTYNPSISANELGHSYDWDNMLMEYRPGQFTNTQGNAVAQLMYDLGTAVQMKWGTSFSAAPVDLIPTQVVPHFKYSKGSMNIGSHCYSEEEWAEKLVTNIKEYGPTVAWNAAHAYVLDGYTTTNYFHVNWGWGGSGNAYVYLPKNEFYVNMSASFYFAPDRDGTSKSRDYLTWELWGKYATDPKTGSNVFMPSEWGIESQACVFNPNQEFEIALAHIQNGGAETFTGYVELVLCDEADNVIETLNSTYLANIAPGTYVQDLIPKKVKFTSELKHGYRLRYRYKGQNTEEWQWLREGANCYEIVLCASPEDVAKNIKMTINKPTKTIKFFSTLALTYELRDETDKVLVSGQTPGGYRFNRDRDFTNAVYIEKGPQINWKRLNIEEGIIYIKCGGEPYTLQIVW